MWRQITPLGFWASHWLILTGSTGGAAAARQTNLALSSHTPDELWLAGGGQTHNKHIHAVSP